MHRREKGVNTMHKEKKELVERTAKKFTQLQDDFHKGYIAGYMAFVMAEKDKTKKTA